MELEALPVVPHTGRSVLWVQKSHKDTSSELNASAPEAEREESQFAGCSSTDVKVTVPRWLQLCAGCCVFNSQTHINPSISVPSTRSVCIVLHSFTLSVLCAQDCWELGGCHQRGRSPPQSCKREVSAGCRAQLLPSTLSCRSRISGPRTCHAP